METQELDTELLTRPVISVLCDEPEGPIYRDVRFLALTPNNLEYLWMKCRPHKTLFGVDISNDYPTFLKLLLRSGANGLEANGLFWVIDDFIGIYYLTDIEPGLDALVHYSFFDGRHRGRLELTRKMLEYVFNEFGFHRLTAIVPLYTGRLGKAPMFEFIENLGFTKEGRKRSCRLHNGEFFDANYYGMLREELNGRAGQNNS